MKCRFVITIITVTFLLFKNANGQSKCETTFNVDSINLNSFLKSNKYSDICKFVLIDSLAMKFNSTGKKVYIKKLNELYKQSDGVYTDQLIFACNKIFEGKLLDWFNIIYEFKNDKTFKKMFIESVSIKMGESKLSEKIINEKLNDLDAKINQEKKSFLQNLRKELNPQVLD